MTDPFRVEGLTVRYRRATACRDVTLAVAPGTVYALLGRNGAGKSSLIRCLLGEQKPTSGRALLFGEDSWRTRAARDGAPGVVPEEPDAPAAMTARDSPDFCRRIYPRWDSVGVIGAAPALRRSPEHSVRQPLQGPEGRGHALSGARARARASRPRRSDARSRRRGAPGALRGDRRRARRPRHDGLPHDARPGRLRGNRDAHRDPERGPARAGRRRGTAQVALPADPLREPHDGDAHRLRHRARRLRRRARQGPGLGHRRGRLELRRGGVREVSGDRRGRERAGRGAAPRRDLPGRRRRRQRSAGHEGVSRRRAPGDRASDGSCWPPRPSSASFPSPECSCTACPEPGPRRRAGGSP